MAPDSEEENPSSGPPSPTQEITQPNATGSTVRDPMTSQTVEDVPVRFEIQEARGEIGTLAATEIQNYPSDSSVFAVASQPDEELEFLLPVMGRRATGVYGAIDGTSPDERATRTKVYEKESKLCCESRCEGVAFWRFLLFLFLVLWLWRNYIWSILLTRWSYSP